MNIQVFCKSYTKKKIRTYKFYKLGAKHRRFKTINEASAIIPSPMTAMRRGFVGFSNLPANEREKKNRTYGRLIEH